MIPPLWLHCAQDNEFKVQLWLPITYKIILDWIEAFILKIPKTINSSKPKQKQALWNDSGDKMKYFWGRWKWTKQTKHMGVIIGGNHKGVELRIKLALITLLPPGSRKTAKQSYALWFEWLFTVNSLLTCLQMRQGRPLPKVSISYIYLMSLDGH